MNEFRKNLTSFITGSHAYGIPTEGSDVDLAILVSEKDSTVLWKAGSLSQNSCRFGNLNLIVFFDEGSFLRWKEVNDKLIKERPVTREYAVKCFQEAEFNNYPMVDVKV